MVWAKRRFAAPLVFVQNRYNVADRSSEPILRPCHDAGIAFLPVYPIGSGELAKRSGPLRRSPGATVRHKMCRCAVRLRDARVAGHPFH
jgi:aryl-alcohol dehydrogenase-like predicted oxidoreductase